MLPTEKKPVLSNDNADLVDRYFSFHIDYHFVAHCGPNQRLGLQALHRSQKMGWGQNWDVSVHEALESTTFEALRMS
jgi:hypothetical protein